MNTSAVTIIESINAKRRNAKLHEYKNIKFVDEKNRVSGKILSHHLMTISETDKMISRILEGGPSWFNVSVYQTNRDYVVISLHFGAPVGAPFPTVHIHDVQDRNEIMAIVDEG